MENELFKNASLGFFRLIELNYYKNLRVTERKTNYMFLTCFKWQTLVKKFAFQKPKSTAGSTIEMKRKKE